MSKSIGLFVLLGSLFVVGCGDKGSTTGGDSSAKPSGTGTSAGGDAKGGYAGYVDAACACKGDTKCLADAGMKFKDSMGDAAKNVDASKKLADCMAANPPKP